MSKSFNLKLMQEKLNKSKEIIKTLDDDFEYINRKKEMAKLEEEYQNYCKQFSPAYLSGSPWYVGPSLLTANINNFEMNMAFFLGCIANNREK